MDVESNRIEYKKILTEDLEREVVAFLNYHEGGEIHIGIDDAGNVVGVQAVDDAQLKIIDKIKNNILPATMGLFDIAVEDVQDKKIIKITISSGFEKPYYLRKYGMSPKGCFIRVGSSVQQMTTSMIDDYYSKRVRITLGNTPSPRTSLTFEQLKIYYETKKLHLNAQFEKSLDLLTESGKYNYAAYMLADENGISIKVAKYAGTNKVDLIENEEYGYCSIIKATKSVLDKLNIENKTFTQITPSTRRERNMVDKVALREAVINAIAHNDYSREVPPVFEIYSDRLTITSYGGLVSGLSETDFFNCRSMPRNRELMRVFKDVGLVEHLGSGMSRILAVYDKSIFEITPNFLVVTFPFEEGFSLPNGNKNGNEVGNENFAIILEAIESNASITLDELVVKTSIKKRTLSREMKRMQEEKIIQRVGSARAGYWEIIE